MYLNLNKYNNNLYFFSIFSNGFRGGNLENLQRIGKSQRFSQQ